MKQSMCWDYITVIDRKSKIAVCNLCDRRLSYKSTVSNLVKHVQRRHHIVTTHRHDESVTNGDEKKIFKPRSAVWTFFNYVNDEKTVCACVHCHKKFNVVEGLETMKKHLLEKHPEALLHHTNNGDPLFITVANDDNKDEESEEDNMQTEYLEMDDTDRQVKIKPNIKRKYNFPQSASFEGRPSLSQRSSFEGRSNMPIYRSPVRSQLELPNSLEHFSNYITSLLQELPEKISKKLQMNFVKQIIEAQISCAEETNCQEEGRKMNSPVVGTVHISETLVESGIVNEETTKSCNADVSNGVIKIANGIIISPIVTTP